MTQLASVVRSRTFAGTTAAAACLAAIVSVGVTGAHGEQAHPTASAGTTTVSGGELTWGVKQSFRTYMVGGIAQGTITPGNGATKDSANVLTFTKGTGGVTKDGDFHVAYTGSAHFYGHEGELDFTLSDPYVSLSKSGTGDLYVMYAVGKGAPKRIKIASLSGTPVVSGDIASVKNAAAKLTTEGVEVFSYKGNGFYPAGQDLDPVSATGKLVKETPAPTTSAPSTPAPTTSAPSTPAPTTSAPSTSTEAPAPTTSTEAPAPTTSTEAPAPSTDPTTPATTDPGTPTGPVVETDLV